MGTSEKKTDLRIQKTLRALTTAVHDLMCEKNLDSITVTEICERAETRKATFYNHFSDKNELVSYMIREYMHSSEEIGDVWYDPQHPDVYYTGIFRNMLDFLDENERMVELLQGSSAQTLVFELYCEQTEPVLRRLLQYQQEGGGCPIELPGMLASIFSGAAIRGASWWFQNRGTVSKEEAVSQFAGCMAALFALPSV